MAFDQRIAASTGLPDRRQTRKRVRVPIEDRLVPGMTAKRQDEVKSRTVVFPADVLDELEPEALARGVHVNALVRSLVTTIVDEKMVGAVLDDETATPEDVVGR